MNTEENGRQEPVAEPKQIWDEPFKPSLKIFEQEAKQAVEELQRPTHGLFISGLLAGFGIGTSVLAIAVVMTLANGALSEPALAVLIANAYTIGFIIVIMGRTDLFTEYTTIAILPILMGKAPLASLGRLWGIIYGANLLGCVLFALLLSHIGPALGVIDAGVFGEMALKLVDHSWLTILLSAFLAGWLMGLLSWLITAGRESISQVFFIWIIAGVIGFGGLHHAITGALEVLVGLFSGQQVSLAQSGHFLLWTTLGNAAGGFVFAVLIRYSVLLQNSGDGLRSSQRDD